MTKLIFLSLIRQRYRIVAIPDKRPELLIDKRLNDSTIASFNGLEARQVTGFNTFDIKGYSPLDEWVFFHVKSRTLIITDLAFHFDRQSSRSAQLMCKVLGGYQQLRPSLLERIATRDKEQVRQSLEPIFAWDFERVIMAHGSIIESNGKQQLQQGYEWFLDAPK